MQRICLTLDLKDDPELIKKYKFWHAEENHWPEINDGIKAAGIQVMDIYLVDNRMFMICELEDHLDFNKCWKEIGKYPRQGDWAELMNNFIQTVPGHQLEWVRMEKVFGLR